MSIESRIILTTHRSNTSVSVLLVVRDMVCTFSTKRYISYCTVIFSFQHRSKRFQILWVKQKRTGLPCDFCVDLGQKSLTRTGPDLALERSVPVICYIFLTVFLDRYDSWLRLSPCPLLKYLMTGLDDQSRNLDDGQQYKLYNLYAHTNICLTHSYLPHT